jgi:hypothetical protein
MEQKKNIKEDDKLEKDLKSLVSRMKSESSALNKILVQLKSGENENTVEKAAILKATKKQ